MYRNELKYQIDNKTAYVLKNRLNKICGYDPNADSAGYYKVASVYFDDYCDSAFNANVNGTIKRKKYRIRIYNDCQSVIRLEKKVKHNQGGYKISAFLTKEQYDLIMQGRYIEVSNIESSVLKAFCVEATSRLLKPKVIVTYNRQSFIYKQGDVRITLDEDIRYAYGETDIFEKNALYLPTFSNNSVVLEVKYTGYLPKHLKDMVQQSSGSQQSISKYKLARLATCKW